MRGALQRNRLESSRMVKQFLIVVIAAVIPAISNAQEAAVVNPVFRRAQTLVNDGNAALVDPTPPC